MRQEPPGLHSPQVHTVGAFYASVICSSGGHGYVPFRVLNILFVCYVTNVTVRHTPRFVDPVILPWNTSLDRLATNTSVLVSYMPLDVDSDS